MGASYHFYFKSPVLCAVFRHFKDCKIFLFLYSQIFLSDEFCDKEWWQGNISKLIHERGSQVKGKESFWTSKAAMHERNSCKWIVDGAI